MVTDDSPQSPRVRVLFVCLGNICRSPSAEGLFRSLVRGAGLEGVIECDSCGSLSFQVGKPPDPRAQREAREHGVELGDLRARLLQAGDFECFDYLVAMDRQNLADLEETCPPDARHKLSLLLSHAEGQRATEVPDPFDGLVSFAAVWQWLEAGCGGLLERVRREHQL